MKNIPENHLKQIQDQLDCEPCDEVLLGEGRMALEYRFVFKCIDESYNPCLDKVTYYAVDIQWCEGDEIYLDDIIDDLYEVKPEEVTRIEWVAV